jgi:hypothetical protein
MEANATMVSAPWDPLVARWAGRARSFRSSSWPRLGPKPGESGSPGPPAYEPDLPHDADLGSQRPRWLDSRDGAA